MKDLTPDRTVDSLYEELVANGIIKMCPEVPLSAFVGHPALHCGTDTDGNAHVGQEDVALVESDFLPASLADVRRTVAETCILPLGKFGFNGTPV